MKAGPSGARCFRSRRRARRRRREPRPRAFGIDEAFTASLCKIGVEAGDGPVDPDFHRRLPYRLVYPGAEKLAAPFVGAADLSAICRSSFGSDWSRLARIRCALSSTWTAGRAAGSAWSPCPTAWSRCTTTSLSAAPSKNPPRTDIKWIMDSAALRAAPRVDVVFEPRDVWVVDGRVISHHLVEGRRAFSLTAKMSRKALPDDHVTLRRRLFDIHDRMRARSRRAVAA